MPDSKPFVLAIGPLRGIQVSNTPDVFVREGVQ